MKRGEGDVVGQPREHGEVELRLLVGAEGGRDDDILLTALHLELSVHCNCHHRIGVNQTDRN